MKISRPLFDQGGCRASGGEIWFDHQRFRGSNKVINRESHRPRANDWGIKAGEGRDPIQAEDLALRIFSFCIRERSVLGLRSKMAAAPCSPSITQRVRSSTLRM